MDLQPLERQVEDTRPVNSLSYLPMSKLTKERWSEEDTEKFYHAVQTVGCDFTMIAKFFQGRTRKQVCTRRCAVPRVRTVPHVGSGLRMAPQNTRKYVHGKSLCCTIEWCMVQVKNKYLKESKINSKRMTSAMSGSHKDVEGLRQMSSFLKTDPEAVRSVNKESSEAAAAAGKAFERPDGAEALLAVERGDDWQVESEPVDPSFAQFFY
jgi:hypothetical protein